MKIIITGEKIYLILVLLIGVFCIFSVKTEFSGQLMRDIMLISAGFGLMGYFFGYFFAKIGLFDKIDNITEKWTIQTNVKK